VKIGLGIFFKNYNICKMIIKIQLRKIKKYASRSSSKMMKEPTIKNPLMFHVVHNNKKIMSENK
jgi:hypothetical protein